MADRMLLFLSGRFSVGNDALIRSFAGAVAPHAPALNLRPGSDPLGDTAIVAVAPTRLDLKEGRRLISSLVGIVPRERVRVLLWHAGVPGSLPPDECEAALGSIDAQWPWDPETCLAAEAAESTIQDVRPKSKLARALSQTAAEWAAWVSHAGSAPVLDPSEVSATVARKVWRRMREEKNPDGSIEEEIETQLTDHLASSGGKLDENGLRETRRRLRDEVLGLGPVDAFLEDPDVSEVMVNGAESIFVERRGRIEKAAAGFPDEDRLRVTISRMVSPAGRRVDQASPLCDVRLKDGSRANVVLPPVAVDGPLVTIRRFRPGFQSLADLVRAGSVTEEEAARLVDAVRQRRNIIIAGNSGAGKTTLLNSLAALIPDEERIITLEDAAELKIQKPHVVRLETRPANAEGRGEVSMRDLVINALRMRPDRLIIGECRGAEAIPMLQAMNTGHDGSMTTLHANSAGDVLQRLEAMVLIGAPQWPPEVVRRQILSAVHLVAYVRRTAGVRKLETLGPLPESGL